MSREQDAPRMSGLRGFLIGIGTTVLAAVVVLALRYAGATKATAPPPAEPATVTPAATLTLPLADHVAAVSGTQDQPATAAAEPSSGSAHAALFSGTIELDKSIAHSVTGTVTVFVIARDRSGKGHPVLAKRLNVASFPTAFSLGPEDAMMGQTPADHLSLEARIDLDGDAMTREPGVPAAKIESVAIGSRHVTLTLKRGA